MQRETSIEDQVRSCREYAERNNWLWQPDQVFTDSGISGLSVEGRPSLTALLENASRSPRSFDVLVVDDSSRLSRDAADALRTVQRLMFAGIRVIFVSQGIDTANEQSELLVGFHGLIDQLYVKEMATKIRRGLAGQLERGFATGGVTYGYRSVLTPDPTRIGETLGFRVEIDPTEAAVVRHVFEWYAEGSSITAIIAKLHESGAPPPRGGHNCGAWRIAAVRRLLVNERYLGKLIWGRSRAERKPGTRTKVLRPLPRKQWKTLERPDLRIVSDELWARVQHRREQLRAHCTKHRQRGRNLLRGRTGLTHGRGLFTGYLRCGVCDNSIAVTSQHRYRGRVYRYYGCMTAAKNGAAACCNHITVRAEAAESALLAGVQAELTRPETLQYLVDQLSSAVQAATDARPSRRQELVSQRDTLTQKIQYLLAAVESGRGTPALLQLLRTRESELARVESDLAALVTPVDPGRLTVIPTWVQQQTADVVALLQDRPERVRAELSRLGVRFTLYPVFDVPEGDRPHLRAEGEGDFQALVGTDAPFPLTDRSLPR